MNWLPNTRKSCSIMKSCLVCCTIIVLISCIVNKILAEEIRTIDGTVYSGTILRETDKAVLIRTETDVIEIAKDDIVGVRIGQGWGIEEHISRDSANDGEQAGSDETVVFEHYPEPVYFPVHSGAHWQYRVKYRPHSLFNESLPELEKDYIVDWVITDATALTKTFYFAQFQHHGQGLYRLTISSHDDADRNTKILFVGADDESPDNPFLVMTDEIVQRDYLFYQRLVAVQPFWERNKEWVDVGQQGGTFFKSRYKVVGIEGIDTEAGYFDDCLVIERIDEVENQTLHSRTYTWYAPQIGMVKMIQEVLYPQVKSGELVKAVLFQEYDLIQYGVN